MLKKIEVGQLRIGMFVHELCSSWLDTPFWQKSFSIKDPPGLQKILDSQIREVWIDTSKGLDVLQTDASVSRNLEKTPQPCAAKPSFSSVRHVSMDEELGRASEIVNNSKQAVYTMFSEARMGKAVDVGEAQQMVEEIAGSVMRNPGALIGLVRLKNKDDYTYMHSVAVCALMIALSRQLGLNDADTREAGLAGLLHDIGKMMVSEEILNKPDKLTDEEFNAVKEHPAEGYKILRESHDVGAVALDVCLHHHEKMNGQGYPERLVAEEISLFARMGAVCDVYDAITSNRPYKQGWCPADSLRKMAEWSNGHFDERVFQAFVRSVGIYPVGTLVRLESQRIGVVVEQQIGKSLLLPRVRVFFSMKAQGYIAPELIDLSQPGASDKIVAREEAAKLGLKDINRFWLGDAASSGRTL